jgi:hypothetical protein
MRKLVLTFLLVLLPLQFAQAAMCPYCCDDEAPFSTQQENDSKAEESLATDEQGNHQNPGPSHQCGLCQLAQSKFISWDIPMLTPFKTLPPYLAETLDYQSYIPRSLDRPNWTHFA